MGIETLTIANKGMDSDSGSSSLHPRQSTQSLGPFVQGG